MQCPQCDDVAMRRRCTSDGVEVETCPECNATWFDRGEIFFFVRLVISSGLITLLEPRSSRPEIERDADDDRVKEARDSLARIVFAAELASEYVVLWLSRTREYHADRFGAEAVGSAAAMGRALVKVAYGLAAEQREARGPEPRAMSIFDRNAAGTLALVTRGATGLSRHGIDESALLGAMKWDLWNPWAFISEIGSTHPLVAKRLLHLSAVSERLGEQPWLRFDLPRPESHWDDFAVDVAIAILPIAMCGIAWTLYESYGRFGLGIGLALVGIGWALKLLFTYPTRWFPEMSVGTLMRRVEVSGVRPIPCRVAGRVIGRAPPDRRPSRRASDRPGRSVIFSKRTFWTFRPS